MARHRRRGSALAFSILALGVGLAVVAASTSGSVTEARATGGSAERTVGWYDAHAGLWASIDDLAAGGPGAVSGSIAGGARPVAGVDGDNDGLVDWTPWADLRALPTGSFEARARAEGPGRWRVHARAVVAGAGVARLETVVVSATRSPFQWGLFGTTRVDLDGNVSVDSWDSDVGLYDAHVVTGRNNSHDIRGQDGNVGSDGDIRLNGNVGVFGVVEAAGTVVVGGSAQAAGGVGVLGTPLAPALPTWSVPPDGPGISNAMLGVPYGGALSRNSGTTLLLPGTYVFSSVSLDSNARVIVSGSPGEVVEIYVTGAGPSWLQNSNTTFEITPPSKTLGPKVVIRTVGSMKLDSNSGLNARKVGPSFVPGDPLQLEVYSSFSSGSADGLWVDSNSTISGALYVPGSGLRLDSNANLYGAAVADRVRADSNVFVHYDVSLANASLGAGRPRFTPVYLREVR